MIAEGSIQISVTVEDGRYTKISLSNDRIRNASSLLVGRDGGEAARLASSVFALCRVAQGLSAAQAIEAAADFVPDGVQQAARALLLAAETVVEHGSRILLDWPGLLGETPDLPAMKTLRSALADLPRALYPDGDWMRPGGGRLDPLMAGLPDRLAVVERVLHTAIFGGEPPVSRNAWHYWAAVPKTAAGRLVAHLSDSGLSGFGASVVPALPDLPLAALEQRLSQDQGGFVRHPDWGGLPHYTGALARRREHLLVSSMVESFGNGLMSRLCARLVDLWLSFETCRQLAGVLCPHPGQELAVRDGQGLSVLEASRGRLAHRVELAEGKVARYQILAPTEWNFHPQGAFAQGLLGTEASPEPTAAPRMLCTALDPCVPFQIEVV